MAWSTKEKYDLDNMNVAAQNVDLGTAISEISGSITAVAGIASGSVLPSDADREVITTGLSTVTSVVASISGSPDYDFALVAISAGSVAGTAILQSFNALYTSASAGFRNVNWIARGTR